jgi:hypothetical protein
MPKSRVSKAKIESTRKPFPTIDDALKEANRLTAMLRELGSLKYPLDIRRGVKKRQKQVEGFIMHHDSASLKAGAKTYLFSIKKARNGDSYLEISESRAGKEGTPKAKAVLYVFPEHAQAFEQAVSQMTSKIN